MDERSEKFSVKYHKIAHSFVCASPFTCLYPFFNSRAIKVIEVSGDLEVEWAEWWVNNWTSLKGSGNTDTDINSQLQHNILYASEKDNEGLYCGSLVQFPYKSPSLVTNWCKLTWLACLCSFFFMCVWCSLAQIIFWIKHTK